MTNSLLTKKASAICHSNRCRAKDGKPDCPLQKPCAWVEGRKLEQWAADVNAAAEKLS